MGVQSTVTIHPVRRRPSPMFTGTLLLSCHSRPRCPCPRCRCCTCNSLRWDGSPSNCPGAGARTYTLTESIAGAATTAGVRAGGTGVAREQQRSGNQEGVGRRRTRSNRHYRRYAIEYADVRGRRDGRSIGSSELHEGEAEAFKPPSFFHAGNTRKKVRHREERLRGLTTYRAPSA